MPTGTRTSVADALFLIVKNDATLKGLTGATAGDPRVYQSYGEKERVLDANFPAYLILTDIVEGNPFLQREDVQYQVSCFALSRNRSRQVQDRLDALLHKQALAATGWNDVSMKRTAGRPYYDPSAGCWQVDITFQIKVWS